MVVPALLRHLALHQPARGLEVEHEDLRLQQRGRDVLALLRLLPLRKRTRIPSAQNSPAQRSAIGMPTRTGPLPRRPVIDISPPMPWAI